MTVVSVMATRCVAVAVVTANGKGLLMSHQIEQFQDGGAAFVSAREDAWHRLGTVLPGTFTAQEAMDHARLGGWNVRKAPLWANVAGQDVPVLGKYATVRDHPLSGGPDPLGVVGERYQVIQNEEHCELLNTLVDESGAHFETAGSLRGGREVFVTMKLPAGVQVGGVDNLDVYLAALNSHDGSSPFRLLLTPVRIVCANTQAAALRNRQASYSIRHTTNAQQNIQQAREALGLTFAYLEEFQAEADRMLDAELTDREFGEIVKRLLPEPKAGKTQRADKAYGEKMTALSGLFSGSATNVAIRGTRWAGYQAVTEWLDHYSPVKGSVSLGLGQTAYARAENAVLSPQIRGLKERAFTAFATV